VARHLVRGLTPPYGRIARDAFDHRPIVTAEKIGNEEGQAQLGCRATSLAHGEMSVVDTNLRRDDVDIDDRGGVGLQLHLLFGQRNGIAPAVGQFAQEVRRRRAGRVVFYLDRQDRLTRRCSLGQTHAFDGQAIAGLVEVGEHGLTGALGRRAIQIGLETHAMDLEGSVVGLRLQTQMDCLSRQQRCGNGPGDRSRFVETGYRMPPLSVVADLGRANAALVITDGQTDLARLDWKTGEMELVLDLAVGPHRPASAVESSRGSTEWATVVAAVTAEVGLERIVIAADRLTVAQLQGAHLGMYGQRGTDLDGVELNVAFRVPLPHADIGPRGRFRGAENIIEPLPLLGESGKITIGECRPGDGSTRATDATRAHPEAIGSTCLEGIGVVTPEVRIVAPAGDLQPLSVDPAAVATRKFPTVGSLITLGELVNECLVGLGRLGSTSE